MTFNIDAILKTEAFFVVNNIPNEFHAKHLRNFFSSFIETSGFICFHFRHRPEKAQILNQKDEKPKQTNTSCCIIIVKNSRANEFLLSYHMKHWVDKEGQIMSKKCLVRRLKLPEKDSSSSVCVPAESNNCQPKNFTYTDFAKLKEFRPPPLLPHGNVGTPTSILLESIRQCQLPAPLISKLGLEFPASRGRYQYSSVPYDYGQDVVSSTYQPDFNEVHTANGVVLSDCFIPQSKDKNESPKHHDEEGTRESRGDSDDDEVEEWDRHEALHDDVTEQERTKPYLYEERIELKWEKGGSGLVFYTDAQYWEQEEGETDFDQKTADDWDIDMSIYYEPNGGDKDAHDLLQMREGKMAKIGHFEKYTKGIGRKIMESQGWKDGQGLGSSIKGISEPLEDLGQDPRNKRGLGYYGEKLCRTFSSRKRKLVSTGSDDEVHIGSKYDDPDITDPPEPLLRSHYPTFMKYRKKS